MLKEYNKFTWWLNLTQLSTIGDGDFSIMTNMLYNQANQVQTRRGYVKFGNSVWSTPFSSYFFHKRDDTGAIICLWVAGTVMYKFDGTNWSSIKTGLIAVDWDGNPTRWDFAVYKNVVYMCDWFNKYASWDGTTYTEIWFSSNVVATFNNTTDIIWKSWGWVHGLSDNMEIEFNTSWTMPAGITAWQTYYVINSQADTTEFQISATYAGTAVNFTTDWSGTINYNFSSTPRCRYISYMHETIYATWDTNNPITVYNSETQAVNGNVITHSANVIWWDEQGKINWIFEMANIALIMKDYKFIWYRVWDPIEVLDIQSWGYSDRSLSIVENSLVFLSERWVDTLKFRPWITWASALESKPLWEKVRELTKLIQPKFYNSNVAYYNKATNNYYFCYDSNWDDRPDKTLVYSSSTQWWSEYLLPPTYDMWQYITDEWVAKHVFTSALWWQMYELEVWFDDDWAKIQAELQTKSFDFWDPWQTYSVSFVDITWFKQEWWDITIKIIWDWWVVQQATITDTNITINRTWSQPLGQRPLWLDPIWWLNTGNDLKLYPFTIKVPMYQYLSTIAVNISWTIQFIFEKLTINVDGQPVELFNYNNIL
jgi:hypothetical protein